MFCSKVRADYGQFLVLATLVSSTLCHVILLSSDSEERLTSLGRDPELLIQTLEPRAMASQIQSLL
jgi:hypothetical protein